MDAQAEPAQYRHNLTEFYKIPDDEYRIICEYCNAIIDMKYCYKEDNEHDRYIICEDCIFEISTLGELD